MTAAIDPTDVPPVPVEALLAAMRAAIADGKGLALLNGMAESDIRVLEDKIWACFRDQPEIRLAVALRFRALLDVFTSRRLKDLFLMNGFKLIARAISEASTQRLNVSYGFRAQAFVMTLSRAPATATHHPQAYPRAQLAA